MAPRHDPDWDPDPLAAPWEPGKAKAFAPREPKDQISLTHDLTEDEVRRFCGFDVFYDPIPRFGFIPQWLLVAGFCTPIGFIAGLGRPPWDSIIRGLAVALAFPLIVLGMLVSVCASRRRLVRKVDLCRGRIVMISRLGLSVRIPGAVWALEQGLGPEIPWIRPVFRPWSAIRRISNDGRDLTFWLRQKGRDNGRARVIIPLRAFESDEEAVAFETAARRWHDIGAGDDFPW